MDDRTFGLTKICFYLYIYQNQLQRGLPEFVVNSKRQKIAGGRQAESDRAKQTLACEGL